MGFLYELAITCVYIFMRENWHAHRVKMTITLLDTLKTTFVGQIKAFYNTI